MQVIKRNKTTQTFNYHKIEKAIEKCLHQIGEDKSLARKYTNDILLIICSREAFVTIEEIQNIVEEYLLEKNLKAYEAYAKYRKEREIIRNLKSKIPQSVVDAFEESKPYFPSPLSQIQFYDKMSRFDYKKGRRETWVELVKDRVIPCLRKASNNLLPEYIYLELEDYLLNCKATPSFRLLAMAGAAAERDNTCIYNCSYSVPDNLRFFAENLYISMCGTGDGFSVENYYISQLPVVKKQTGEILQYTFEDNTESWCNGTLFAITAWYEGKDVEFDFSKIRKEGAILKTKGGRASGPKPLKKSLELIREIILGAQERQLFSDEICDVVCLEGDCAISGGVRRTAKICICDFGDERMRAYKQGNYYKDKPWRGNANISEAFIRDYSQEEIREFVKNMDDSKRGENGIFSRINAVLNAPRKRIEYWEKKLGYKITRENAVRASYELKLGVNPCGEIILSTFCNLSIAVARNTDSFEDLKKKVRIATIFGTIQAKCTYFPYLNNFWKEISEEERLLGVDIIGQADFGFLTKEQLQELKQIVIDTNAEIAPILQINTFNAGTCVKPGGNSGAFLAASSSISKHKYKYWIRNIEVNIFTPIFKVLKHSKIPGFPKPGYEHNTYIFSIPQKAPEGALVQENDTLREQLDYWLLVKENYTDHNPSCTLYYKLEELEYMNKWIYEHQNVIGGLTFLPNVDLEKLGFDYLPIQRISEEEYIQRIENFPDIDWKLLWVFDGQEDNTTVNRELACAAGQCEI